MEEPGGTGQQAAHLRLGSQGTPASGRHPHASAARQGGGAAARQGGGAAARQGGTTCGGRRSSTGDRIVARPEAPREALSGFSPRYSEREWDLLEGLPWIHRV